MLLGGVVLSLAALLAGVVLLRARLAPLTAVLLAASGVAGLATVWAEDVVLLVVTTLLFAPATCWAFPVPRWRSSADVVLGVLLLAPGVVALTDPHDSELVATMGLVAATAVLVQTWFRVERSEGDERRALLWFGVAAGFGAFVALTLMFLTEGGPELRGFAVGVLVVVPAAMVVGVLRPELVDVRGLVVYAVVVAVAASAFVAYYVGIYELLEQLGDESPEPAVQAVIGLLGGAALYPGSQVLRGVIDRLLFGDRPDALRAATRALGRFGAEPETALTAIRESLLLPFARLVVDGEVVATSGEEVSARRAVPLSLTDGTTGELVVGLRPGDLRLSPTDEQVLSLVAPLLAASVRARALAEDLHQSRGAAIAAIEEERRRLRRDLHDGLGPTLSGIAFSADAARNSVRTDPAAAESVLKDLRADAAEAVEAIRRLVYGMRPPALDELGLEGALRQQAGSVRNRDGLALRVDVEESGGLDGLPAAVEVAAYRIVTEALTNVARHSRGSTVSVRLCREPGELVVEVLDDGATEVTAEGEWRPGVGGSSMRERAAEVGGEVTWGPTPEGGRVRARLPT